MLGVQSKCVDPGPRKSPGSHTKLAQIKLDSARKSPYPPLRDGRCALPTSSLSVTTCRSIASLREKMFDPRPSQLKLHLVWQHPGRVRTTKPQTATQVRTMTTMGVYGAGVTISAIVGCAFGLNWSNPCTLQGYPAHKKHPPPRTLQ